MTEQKPSSKKVSMNVRIMGLHTTHFIMCLEMRLQHSHRKQSFRRTVKKTIEPSKNQMAMKTPEFSRRRTDS